MASITLPDTVVPNGVTPFLRTFGGVLTPLSGGEEQILNRLGMRMAGRFSIPPKRYARDGMVLVSRLIQAKTSRLIMDWPQPGFDPGNENAPKVRVAVSGGTTLQLKGVTADLPMFEGQALSMVKDRRYLHVVTAPALVDGSGNVALSVWPPMRVAFAVNDVVEIQTPKIEGHVLPNEELSWSISVDRLLDVSFSVVEAK